MKAYKMNHRRALTLIEMAVVGTCASALLAACLPTLTSVRQDAARSKCLANLGGIARATQVYSSDDPDQNTIPVGVAYASILRGSYIWGGKMGTGGEDIENNPVQSPFGAGQDAGPGTRPLNPYLYKDNVFAQITDWTPDWEQEASKDVNIELPIYHCPADTGHTSTWDDNGGKIAPWSSTQRFAESGQSAYDFYGSSYVANTFWVSIVSGGSVVPQDGDAVARIFSMGSFLHSLNRIRSPQTTITYHEANSRYAYNWIPQGASSGNCVELENTPSGGQTMGWHGQPWRFNSAFADGSARMITMNGRQFPPPDLGDAYPYLSGGPGSYSQYCQVTIRGNGWQIDTLPSFPVKAIHGF